MTKSAFHNLFGYITKRMRMSHIYQPVMLRELLVRGGEASIDDIANALLSHDTSQVEYYGLRVKNMVGKVLTSNGITSAVKEGRSIRVYRLELFV